MQIKSYPLASSGVMGEEKKWCTYFSLLKLIRLHPPQRRATDRERKSAKRKRGYIKHRQQQQQQQQQQKTTKFTLKKQNLH